MEHILLWKKKIISWRAVHDHWFFIVVLASIFLAHRYPAVGITKGPLKPEWTGSAATMVIFLMSGLSVNGKEVKRAVMNVHVHVFIQGFTFFIFPLLLFIASHFIQLLDAPEWSSIGVKILGCMPPPVSSAIILTRSANGNEPAAMFNCVLGSFLGIFLTPLLLLHLVGVESDVTFMSTVMKLGLTVLVPFLVGQWLRDVAPRHLVDVIPCSHIGKVMLAFIIFTTFCDMFDQEDLFQEELGILEVVVSVAVFHGCLLLGLFFVSTKLIRFRPIDTIAVVFTSSHKSLTLGIPILRAVFANHQHLTGLCLPLLIYHPVQILLGGLAVPQIKQWIQNSEVSRHPTKFHV